MARVKKNPEERKAEIFEAARHLFAENGFDQTTVSDIVKAVGVSQGSFYWYFDSKEDVLEKLADDVARKHFDEIEAILTDDRLSASKKLDRFLRNMHKLTDQGGLLVEDLHSSKHKIYHDKMARRYAGRYTELVRNLVREGIDEGVFDVPDPDTAALFLLLPGLFSHLEDEIPFLSEITPERWFQNYREMAHRVLGCR